MAIDIFANNASATVSSGGTTAPAAGTSEAWTLASIVGLTASTGVTQMRLTDPAASSEIMLLTNLSGTAATVTRGAEGTAPVAHAANFIVQAVASASALAKGSWQEVTREILSANVTEIDLNIPSDAKLLRVTGWGFYINTANGGAGTMSIRFNSDSSTSYYTGSNSTTAVAQISGPALAGNQVYLVNAASGQSNSWFEIIVSILSGRLTQTSSRSNSSGVRESFAITEISGMWIPSPNTAPTTMNLIDLSANGFAPGGGFVVEKIA